MGIVAGMKPTELGQEYELDWPADLFRVEAEALLQRYFHPSDFEDRGAWLLEEAFVDDSVAREFRQNTDSGARVFPISSSQQLTQKQLLAYLADNAEQLPKMATISPYWMQRFCEKSDPLHEISDAGTLQGAWSELVTDFKYDGYFANVAPEACIDDYGEPQEVDDQLDFQVRRRVGQVGLWHRTRKQAVEKDTLFTLIEVFHDLASRPRYRTYHDFGDCGWHHEDHFRPTGQALYRWRVNALLERYNTGLRLADSGEDRGRLIQHLDVNRAALIKEVIDSPEPVSRDSVNHAIALFRKRDATRDDKRSACLALARVLEANRPLLKGSLLKNDESLLFQLANNFDLRHRDGRQYDDYGEEFIDWIFWIYLSTVDLINRLLKARGQAAT